ncbi:hypothetical protein LXL04_037939 [Taraxacum kok-saghyz]
MKWILKSNEFNGSGSRNSMWGEEFSFSIDELPDIIWKTAVLGSITIPVETGGHTVCLNIRTVKHSMNSSWYHVLTSLLSEAGLNIQEAHACSTADGFSLDVFVGESYLEVSSSSTISKIVLVPTPSDFVPSNDHVKIPTDGADVWEIDANLLKFENKVTSGTFGDL